MMASKPENPLLPVLSLLFAATMWGVVWYPLRLLEAQGLVGLWTTLASYAAALMVGIWLVIRQRRSFQLQPGWLLALALAAGWTNVSFILAVLDGTVMRVLLLFYLSPLWTLLLGLIFLHERLSRPALGVFALAMTGAMIMLWDVEMGMPWPREAADWLAVSSGFCFALTNVLVRKLQQVPVAVKTVSSWLGVLSITVVWLLVIQLPPPVVSGGVWLGAAALGVFGFVTMTLSVQYGVTRMPVHRSAVILLFELVAGAVSSLWLTNEIILPLEWLGGGLIIAAALLAARMDGETT